MSFGRLGLERRRDGLAQAEQALGEAVGAAQQPLDRGEVEAVGLQVEDQAQPCDVLGVVVADARAHLGRGQQPARMVVADVAHRHPDLGGELLDRQVRRGVARARRWGKEVVAHRLGASSHCRVFVFSAVCAIFVQGYHYHVTSFEVMVTEQHAEARKSNRTTTQTPPSRPWLNGARSRRSPRPAPGAGMIRSFTSPLLPDDYLELINPLWSTRELRGRVERIEREAPNAATVLIKPGWEWPRHRPGQYLRLGIEVDGVHHWRAYSLTSDPGRTDGCISITPKLVADGKVSPFLFSGVRPGTIVRLGGVEGTFVLPDPLPAGSSYCS